MNQNTLLIVQKHQDTFTLQLPNNITEKIGKFLNAINIINGVLTTDDIWSLVETKKQELKLVLSILFKFELIDGDMLLSFGMSRKFLEKELRELDVTKNEEIKRIQKQPIKLKGDIKQIFILPFQPFMKW